MENALKEFLNSRNIPSEKLEDEKIDISVILAMEPTELCTYFPKHGDRISVLQFCRETKKSSNVKINLLEKLRQKIKKKNNTDNSSTSSEESIDFKRKKSTRKIELGWIHDGKQMRTKQGGGTRKVDIEKTSLKKNIIAHAIELFFPQRNSGVGSLEDITVRDLKDFKNKSINHTTTVEEMYDLTKLPRLRFYLSTESKDKASSMQKYSEEGNLVEVLEDSQNSRTENKTVGNVRDEEINFFRLSNNNDENLGVRSSERYVSENSNDDYINNEEFPGEQNTLQGIIRELGPSERNRFEFVIADQLEETSKIGDNPKILHLIMHRGHILRELINEFQNIDINENILIQVEISLPNGNKEAGVDVGGVFRDALSEFWSDFYETCTVGAIYKVPMIRDDFTEEMWKSVAKIIYIGWHQVKYFPIKIAPVFMEECIFDVFTSHIQNVFMKYLNPWESKVLKTALESWENSNFEDVLEVLSNFECRRRPSKDNFVQLMFDVAHKELIQKPKFIMDCWHYFLQTFISKNELQKIYQLAVPSAEKIINLLQFKDSLCAEEIKIISFLKKFIRESDSKCFSNFLRFCTGADIITNNNINLVFNSLSGIQRRPISHTCGCVLELSLHYQDFRDFRSDMNSVLTSNIWIMEIV